MPEQPPEREPIHDAWALAQSDPEVLAAHAAIDAHEAQEGELYRQLGLAVRGAEKRAAEHLAACDPWIEPCGRCGRTPTGLPSPA